MGHIFTFVGKSISSPFILRPLLPFQSRACAVGHNPNPVSSMSGIDGTSRNNKRPRGVADAFQVRKDIVEFHRDDSSNVLTNDPTGVCAVNNSEHLRPERTVICRAFSLPGDAERLTRKSPCEQVNPCVVGAVEGEDVVMESRAYSTMLRGQFFLLLPRFGASIAAVGVGMNP